MSCTTTSTASSSRRARARPSTSSTPRPARCTRPRRGPARRDVDDAMQAAQAAFDGDWRDTTPSERMAYMLKMADAIEENAEAPRRRRGGEHGQAQGPDLSEEIPPMCDQIRFFAGAARILEGKATGEYMRGFTSSIRREPIGVIGSVAPWNYPMMMAVVEVRARARGGQHDRAQAVRHDAGQHRATWPSCSPRSCRRACSTSSAATATPARPWSAIRSRRWSRSRAAPGRQGGRAGRRRHRSSAAISSWAARRP